MHICPDELVAFGLLITFAKPVWLRLKAKIKNWKT
jgi:hypothetical protein